VWPVPAIAMIPERHQVKRAGEAQYAIPEEFSGRSGGFRRWSMVDHTTPGAVHTGFGISELDPEGSIGSHVHSFEETVYLLEGSVQLVTAGATVELAAGDYGLIPLGVAHAWRNPAGGVARWADLFTPQPRPWMGSDTFFVPELTAGPPISVDPRDPRTRAFGHIAPENMDPARQNQEMLAVSASMRTALLVYSGITVKMMSDTDLGAQLSTMFMVQYEPRGVAGAHDHPLEETYLILDGEVDGVFDGVHYRLRPGDVAFAGVGVVHEFSNPTDTTVRWLETQSPAPPARHSYRFARDWRYLSDKLAKEEQ
jgi:quercetin dioxygenase-like cupin family protein